jgi:hypothetical protein
MYVGHISRDHFICRYDMNVYYICCMKGRRGALTKCAIRHNIYREKESEMCLIRTQPTKKITPSLYSRIRSSYHRHQHAENAERRRSSLRSDIFVILELTDFLLATWQLGK